MQASVSHLRLAWGVLAALAVAILGGSLLVPAPKADEPTLVVDIPQSLDRMASGPAVPIADQAVLIPEPSTTASSAAPSQTAARPVAGQPKVISIPERLAALPEPAGAMDAAAPPPGALVITLPSGSSGAVASNRAAVVREPLPFDPKLSVATDYGVRPALMRGRSETPFDRYRHISDGTGPRMAIMVSGLGLDGAKTMLAIDALPSAVSLSFAPYGRDVPVLMERAAAAGHEVAIELPMAQSGVPDEALGTAALSSAQRADALYARLDWLLSRAPAYAMVTNYLGRSFKTDGAAVALVMDRLAQVGVGYVDDTGLAEAAATSRDIPYIAVREAVVTPQHPLAKQLDVIAAAATATPDRIQVVKVYASQGGLEQLLDWLGQEGGDVRPLIVPVSAAMADG